MFGVLAFVIDYFEMQHHDFADPPQRKEPHVEKQGHLKRQAGYHICIYKVREREPAVSVQLYNRLTHS